MSHNLAIKTVKKDSMAKLSMGNSAGFTIGASNLLLDIENIHIYMENYFSA